MISAGRVASCSKTVLNLSKAKLSVFNREASGQAAWILRAPA